MPRTSNTRITDRQASNPEYRTPVRTQAVAGNVDFLSGATPRPNSDLDGLLAGLQSFSPALQTMQAQSDKEAKAKATGEEKQGATVAAAGGERDDSKSVAWINGHQALTGTVDGEADGIAAQEAYKTQFNKDSGEPLEPFLNKLFDAKTRGLKPGAYLDSYSAAFNPMMVKLRAEHLTYEKKAVTSKVESNAMQIMDGMARAYINVGQPIPTEALESMGGFVGDSLGVTKARFNDLKFASLKRLGDEGNFAVYETFKRNNTDGTPGMYYDPEWKEKIDLAEMQSMTAYNTKRTASNDAVKKDREDRQDAAMLPILLAEDPKDRENMFTVLVQSGIFERGTEVDKWRKILASTDKREASLSQMETASELQYRIIGRELTGRKGMNEIRDADLTPEQKRALWSDLSRLRNEDATLSAQQRTANSAARAETRETNRSYADYVRDTLKGTPSATDWTGEGNAAQRRLAATARLEFNRRVARGEPPAAVSDEIVKRFLPRFNDAAGGKLAPTDSLLRYPTAQELAGALKRGEITLPEFNQQAETLRAIKKEAKPK